MHEADLPPPPPDPPTTALTSPLFLFTPSVCRRETWHTLAVQPLYNVWILKYKPLLIREKLLLLRSVFVCVKLFYLISEFPRSREGGELLPVNTFSSRFSLHHTRVADCISGPPDVPEGLQHNSYSNNSSADKTQSLYLTSHLPKYCLQQCFLKKNSFWQEGNVTKTIFGNLGFWLHDKLDFKKHTNKEVTTSRTAKGFFFYRLVQLGTTKRSTSQSIIVDWDVIFMFSPASTPKPPDSVFFVLGQNYGRF